MVTKATNSVLDLVSPPIDDIVLLHGTWDSVTIGSHVPAPIFATQITDTELATPLIGALAGRLTGVTLGSGLALSGNVLHVTFPPPPVSTTQYRLLLALTSEVPADD